MNENKLKLLLNIIDTTAVSRARKARVRRRYISIPKNMTLDASDTQVIIGWEAPDVYQVISGYKILSSGIEVADIPASPLLTYIHTGLTPQTTYSYSIYAYNQYGGTSGMLQGSTTTTL